MPETAAPVLKENEPELPATALPDPTSRVPLLPPPVELPVIMDTLPLVAASLPPLAATIDPPVDV